MGQGWDFGTIMKASGKGKVRNFRARMRAQARTWASGNKRNKGKGFRTKKKAKEQG